MYSVHLFSLGTQTSSFSVLDDDTGEADDVSFSALDDPVVKDGSVSSLAVQIGKLLNRKVTNIILTKVL